MKKILQTILLVLMSGLAQADTSSDISISTADSHTVTGVYLQALAAGVCPGTGVFSNPSNATFGAMWTGGIALNNQSITLGANYLYEMIYIAIYEGYQSNGSINTPTTPGSNSYDGGSNAWCINLGIAGGAPVIPDASVTTSLLAFGSSNSISITCNDSTISCTASSPVVQNF